MEKNDSIIGAIGIVAALIALGDALENFWNAALHWRLMIAAIACGLVLWATAGALSSWTASERGFGFRAPLPKRSFIKPFISGAGLAIVCAIFVWASSWLLVDRNTFQLRQTKTPNKSDTLLIAPYSRIENVTIELPAFKDDECSWNGKDLHLILGDIDTPTPRLELENFEYPQRIEISCTLPNAIESVTTKPPTRIYTTEDLGWWQLWSKIVGGLIWLIAGLRLWFLSG